MSYCPCCKCMNCHREMERVRKEIDAAGGPDAYLSTKFQELRTKWFKPIVTAPADSGKGRISAYDSTWPDLHEKGKK